MIDFIAAYRIQLSAQFQFTDLIDQLDYLAGMGVSHLYLSPVIESEPGSTHGYDGVDPRKISVERGGEQGFRQLCEVLQTKFPQMGIILDIVPNHLGVSWNNPYWRDVLENGRASEYSCLFDINWSRLAAGKLMLPALGHPLKTCLENGEIKVDFLSSWGIVLKYYDNLFPCELKTYARLINGFLLTENTAAEIRLALEEVIHDINRLPSWQQSESDRSDEAKSVRNRFLSICSQHNLGNRFSDYLMRLPQQGLAEVLDEQAYQLEYWRDGLLELNYRRFFDISQLAGVRTEDPAVFDFLHEKIFELARAYPCIHGYRIDHIDGLKDPTGYLNKLSRFQDHIWVEKILGHGEDLPPSWPVMGTVGYEYLNAVDQLFIKEDSLTSLTDKFLSFVPEQGFDDALIQAKSEVLENLFQTELNALSENLSPLLRETYDAPLIKQAIIVMTSHLPVYRTYYCTSEPEVRGEDEALLLKTIETCRNNTSSGGLLSIFAEVAGLVTCSPVSQRTLQWLEQWQQLSGPAMAKGLEDTTLYRIFPLSCLNEVGAHSSTRINNSVENYINFVTQRSKRFPYAINPSSTHDTKRSEDVRYRIAALSEWSEEFVELFNVTVQNFNKNVPPEVKWLVVQSCIGVWPIEPIHKNNPASLIGSRLQSYVEKALRESKRYSDWLDPNSELENQTKRFIDEILADEQFKTKVAPLLQGVGRAGAINSLCATTLKLISPGLVDFYQGSEQWHQYLVDPDNRQPVDYVKLQDSLERIRSAEPAAFLREWQNGLIKQSVIYRLIQQRQAAPQLFTQGRLEQLPVHGAKAEHVVAVRLTFENDSIVAIFPRLVRGALEADRSSLTLSPSFWRDTHIDLQGLPGSLQWNCIMTGKTRGTSTRLNVGDALSEIPFCVWSSVQRA